MKNNKTFNPITEFEQGEELRKSKKGIPNYFLPPSTSAEPSYLEQKQAEAKRQALQNTMLQANEAMKSRFGNFGRSPALGEVRDIQSIDDPTSNSPEAIAKRLATIKRMETNPEEFDHDEEGNPLLDGVPVIMGEEDEEDEE